MSSPIVSVIIPAYNGGGLLREAIQSVLDQTYPDFELIVVDDASPDHTAEIVGQFDDPRVKYIRHEKNLGAVAARHTGFRASSGEIIAFLDQDDLFHPGKLHAHITFLGRHPEIGVTYNSRFNLEHPSKRIIGIWQPPAVVTLADLVLGFPFAPSDTVIRREWALRDEMWDSSFVSQRDEVIFNGGEIVAHGRLAMAGCKFAGVGRALNYRRLYAGRIFSNLSARCASERTCQEIIFADPRCPDEVLALRNLAFMNTYLIWAYYAFAQDETTVGQAFLSEAVRLNPSILEGRPCQLVKFLAATSISDESRGHETLLQHIFACFPPGIASLSDQYHWAVARGYLLKGARAGLWDRAEEARVCFARAAEMGAEVDEPFMQMLTHQLLTCEVEYDRKATQRVIRNLAPYLEQVGNRGSARRLNGCYWISRAFQSYRAGDHGRVWREAARGIVKDPKHVVNRGVLSILVRSIANARLK